jgi:hypothetical protein
VFFTFFLKNVTNNLLKTEFFLIYQISYFKKRSQRFNVASNTRKHFMKSNRLQKRKKHCVKFNKFGKRIEMQKNQNKLNFFN